ncbi:MAG: transposase zinc-binding domain-containing protein [Cytophagaceae bacterium]|nr:transposase zinc-binding domain-containing protein [Cytophagaceae bacterium]
MDACDSCGNISIVTTRVGTATALNAKGEKREEWIQAREAELLPVPYFHVVFTLPSELNSLVMHEPRALFDALFAATWQTVAVFSNHRIKVWMARLLLLLIKTTKLVLR